MAAEVMDAATSTAFFGAVLVLFMTLPGLALFYGSLISRKNLVDTMLQSVVLTCTITVLWWVIGYSLCFGESKLPFVGGTDLMLLGFSATSKYNDIPQAIWCGFQLTFAIITPAVAVGAVAERALLWPTIVFANMWLLVVYCPVCHMVWGPGGLLADLGILDLAGGTVVEICSGVTALVLCAFVGERSHQTEEADPARAVLHIIGASFLWVGWLAFNGASAMTNGFQASAALLNTMLCGASGALAWGSTAAYMDSAHSEGMPHVQATFNLMGGALAGLVAATPSSGFVNPSDSVIIGLGAGVVCFFAERVLMEYVLVEWKIDDAVSVFPVHGVGGIWGTFMTGVLAREEIGGTAGAVQGNYLQVLVQIASILVTCLWTAAGTALCAFLVQRVVTLRACDELQEKGFDFHSPYKPLGEADVHLLGDAYDDDRQSTQSEDGSLASHMSFWSVVSNSMREPMRISRFTRTISGDSAFTRTVSAESPAVFQRHISDTIGDTLGQASYFNIASPRLQVCCA